jgi:hypothetical protein
MKIVNMLPISYFRLPPLPPPARHHHHRRHRHHVASKNTLVRILAEPSSEE